MIPASSNRAANAASVGDDDEIVQVDPYSAARSRDGVVERYHDEEAEPEQPRYKYSSQHVARNNNTKSRCRKYCCIIVMFLIFVGFSIGLSFLINYLFFSDDGDTGGAAEQPFNLANGTLLPRDKATVDAACSPATFNQDGGKQCSEVCEPQFSSCCKAFLDSDIMANETGTVTNASSTGVDGSSNFENTTFATGVCSLDTQTQGCASYSKCIAASGIDPAPTALPKYCAPSALEKDPQSCQSLCEKHKCCYNQEGMTCLGDTLDVCMDYAPCQNLRTQKEAVLLEPAPANLDQLCYYGAPDCIDACKKAECCNLNATSTTPSCLSENIVSCLTYAACGLSNKTSTKIDLAPQFNLLPKLPAELIAACDERNPDFASGSGNSTCEQLCIESTCCTASENNCFDKDPLGCLAWSQYCQVSNVQLGSPP
jgi:hypothetical protein